MEVNFGRGEILHMEDEQIQQACTIILNAGLAHVANLGDYGVTAVKLTNFETLIANWHVESQLPRVAIAARKVATKAIPVLLRQMDVILKDQLDKLMVLFKDSEPTFYNTYVEARKVVDSGHGAKGPRLSGTVTGHNGALLLDALVRATYLDKVVEARTDAYGAFSMRLPGVVANTEVTVTASKLGYVTDVRVQTMQPKVNVALTIGAGGAGGGDRRPCERCGNAGGAGRCDRDMGAWNGVCADGDRRYRELQCCGERGCGAGDVAAGA
jgi:hypothetical protein